MTEVHGGARSPVARAREPLPEGAGADCRDLHVLDEIRNGSVAALQALIDLHWPRLLAYASRLLDDGDAAEDIVQDAFVRLWESRARLGPDRSARALIYTITRNLALNRRKSITVRTRLLTLRRSPGTAPSTPAEDLTGRELADALASAIRSLPERRREILLLSRYDDLSRQEIADLLGLSPQTVANHLAAAIADLKRKLRPFLSSD